MIKDRLFTPGEFTPTEWSTAEDKAKFANQFVKFVRSDFADKDFPKWFYQRLSNCFGHIAHFDQAGFYQTFFTCTDDKIAFICTTLDYPCYGDPTFTFSDVEKPLKEWLDATGLVYVYQDRLTAEIEAHEKAQYAALCEKYGGIAS